MTMVAMQDIETQKNGVVGIYYALKQRKFMPGRIQEFWISWKAFPFKIVAFHFCADPMTIRIRDAIIVAFFKLCEENSVACRTRMHKGMCWR